MADPLYPEGHPYADPKSQYQTKWRPLYKELYGEEPKTRADLERFRTRYEFDFRAARGEAERGDDRALALFDYGLQSDYQGKIQDKTQKIAERTLDTIRRGYARDRADRKKQQEAILKQGYKDAKGQAKHLANTLAFNRQRRTNAELVAARDRDERQRYGYESAIVQGKELQDRRQGAERTLAFRQNLVDDAVAERAKAERIQERATRSQIFSSLGFTDRSTRPKVNNPIEPLLLDVAENQRKTRLTPLY